MWCVRARCAAGPTAAILPIPQGERASEPFVLAELLYFSVLGVFIGYLWSRVTFWQILTLVDRIHAEDAQRLGRESTLE
jgi:hypothetical protein